MSRGRPRWRGHGLLVEAGSEGLVVGVGSLAVGAAGLAAMAGFAVKEHLVMAIGLGGVKVVPVFQGLDVRLAGLGFAKVHFVVEVGQPAEVGTDLAVERVDGDDYTVDSQVAVMVGRGEDSVAGRHRWLRCQQSRLNPF